MFSNWLARKVCDSFNLHGPNSVLELRKVAQDRIRNKHKNVEIQKHSNHASTLQKTGSNLKTQFARKEGFYEAIKLD